MFGGSVRGLQHIYLNCGLYEDTCCGGREAVEGSGQGIVAEGPFRGGDGSRRFIGYREAGGVFLRLRAARHYAA